MPEWTPDVTPLLQTPLAKGAYLAIGIGFLVWLVTEAASFVVPAKWRPALPLVGGPFLGWATQAASLLDFGAGPGSWGRALIFGLAGGALAIVGHPLMKKIPPFSYLTRVTPGTPVTPVTPQGGTGS